MHVWPLRPNGFGPSVLDKAFLVLGHALACFFGMLSVVAAFCVCVLEFAELFVFKVARTVIGHIQCERDT